MADDDEPHEEFELQFSELHDGTASEAQRAAVMAHLETCAACKAAYAEFERTMAALSTVKTPKQPAPAEFGKHVEDTIAARSAGRFFGRKTLGDRVPFGALLIVALLVLLAIAALIWASPTGSLERRDGAHKPELAPGARDVVQPH
jgi:anti-sigma factor RsiW